MWGVLIDTWIRKSILDKNYNQTGSSRSNVSLQTFQGTKNMEMSPLWPSYALSHLSPFCLSPNTHHRPPSCLYLQTINCSTSSLCHFFPTFNKHWDRSLKESALAGDRNTLLGLRFGISPPALELSSQARDCAAPWCRRCHLPNVLLCFSKWAQKNILSVAAGVRHSCHRNIRTQPGLEVDSGSGGRLGKWPMSRSHLPMFPFGDRDSWLSTARDGSGEPWCSLVPLVAHPRRCKFHTLNLPGPCGQSWFLWGHWEQTSSVLYVRANRLLGKGK